MAQWTIAQEQGEHGSQAFYVKGLKSQGLYRTHDDTLLLHVYADGDAPVPGAAGEALFGALYDLYQTNEELRPGDTFVLNGEVLYRASGMHILPVQPAPGPPAAAAAKPDPAPSSPPAPVRTAGPAGDEDGYDHDEYCALSP